MHEYNFFVPPQDQDENFVFIRGDEYNHCCRVLRKSEGAVVSVFDGQGNKKDVKLIDEKDHCVRGKVIRQYPVEQKIKPYISLGVGVVRNKAMKKIIQQGTNLGIDEFYPLNMQNCIKHKFRRDKFIKKSIAAAKQSGTSHLPKIGGNLEVEEWLDKSKDKDLRLLAHQEGHKSLAEICNRNPEVENIAVTIGPEGGFHDQELELFINRDFTAVNIFPFRLRTELAVTNILAGIYHIYN
jgi:16S rRNA (uracil1498-N3)-methyltransferase